MSFVCDNKGKSMLCEAKCGGGGGLNKYAALAQSFFACFSHIELVPQASALHWFAALA